MFEPNSLSKRELAAIDGPINTSDQNRGDYSSLRDAQRFGAGEFPQFVIAKDVNGDGQLDLITANDSSNDVSVLLGNGDGTFAAEQRLSVGTRSRSATASDLNGDGKLDLITANYFNGDVSVLLNLF